MPLRCKPLSPAAGGGSAPAWAERLIERLGEEPERVLTAADIRQAGAEPATASRYFKSKFGASLQALSRARRVGVALRWIREGEGVARATHRAGFASESGFRKAVRELFGSTPGEAAKAGAEPIVARWLGTPLGPMLAASSTAGVCLLEFVDRRALATQLATLRKRLGRPIVPGGSKHLDKLEGELAAYFGGSSMSFSVAIDAPGTEFQRQVWEELSRIEPGTTRSYSKIAASIGRPKAVRAVARANGDNRLAIIIPCHRVIGSDMSPVGYGGGVWRKVWLLEHERKHAGIVRGGQPERPGAKGSAQGVLEWAR